MPPPCKAWPNRFPLRKGFQQPGLAVEQMAAHIPGMDQKTPRDILAEQAHLPRFEYTLASDVPGIAVAQEPEGADEPRLMALNATLAEVLGFDAGALDETALAAFFSGAQLPDTVSPVALAYAGHQFGNFVPRLGDGRAHLLGEVVDVNGTRRDVQLKGSGRTVFSRGGDGRAAVGPVLREYIISEAMHALGIPTTRSLAAVATGERIFRERLLPGAVLTRVASSHLRTGSFQYFAARGDKPATKQLADHAIARHYPEIAGSENPYLELVRSVGRAQASLVAKWMHAGFVHGVMNTDNSSISGETIDYGPCAFMDRHSANTVFSSIDRQERYAYGNQPPIAQWNLARLAETLIPLIHDDPDKAVDMATDAVGEFASVYKAEWLSGMRSKLGLYSERDEDFKLATDLLATMEEGGADHTLTFRHLSDWLRGEREPLRSLFIDPTRLDSWAERWQARLLQEALVEDRADRMERTNPLYIPRNHKVEEALAAAEGGDMVPFEKIMAVLAKPYEAAVGFDDYATPPAGGADDYVTFCGT